MAVGDCLFMQAGKAPLMVCNDVNTWLVVIPLGIAIGVFAWAVRKY